MKYDQTYSEQTCYSKLVFCPDPSLLTFMDQIESGTVSVVCS